MNRKIRVMVYEDNEQQEVISSSFTGDELTSPEQQAIEFLKSIEKDPLDE